MVRVKLRFMVKVRLRIIVLDLLSPCSELLQEFS